MKTTATAKTKKSGAQGNFKEYLHLFSKAVTIRDRSKRDEEIRLVFALFRRNKVFLPRGRAKIKAKAES